MHSIGTSLLLAALPLAAAPPAPWCASTQQYQRDCPPIPALCSVWNTERLECAVAGRGELRDCSPRAAGTGPVGCTEYTVPQAGSLVRAYARPTPDKRVAYRIDVQLEPCEFLLAVFGDDENPLVLPAATQGQVMPASSFSRVNVEDALAEWRHGDACVVTDGAWFQVPERIAPSSMREATATTVFKLTLPAEQRATLRFSVQLYQCIDNGEQRLRTREVRGVAVQLAPPEALPGH